MRHNKLKARANVTIDNASHVLLYGVVFHSIAHTPRLIADDRVQATNPAGVACAMVFTVEEPYGNAARRQQVELRDESMPPLRMRLGCDRSTGGTFDHTRLGTPLLLNSSDRSLHPHVGTARVVEGTVRPVKNVQSCVRKVPMPVGVHKPPRDTSCVVATPFGHNAASSRGVNDSAEPGATPAGIADRTHLSSTIPLAWICYEDVCNPRSSFPVGQWRQHVPVVGQREMEAEVHAQVCL